MKAKLFICAILASLCFTGNAMAYVVFNYMISEPAIPARYCYNPWRNGCFQFNDIEGFVNLRMAKSGKTCLTRLVFCFFFRNLYPFDIKL